MNNKGFSLVELLAIITILGVIMGVAVTSQQKHVTKTRNEGYKTLITTARTAAQNRFMAEGLATNCVKYDIVGDLYQGGFMDKPADPASTSSDCTGEVYIKTGNTTDLMENYNITVHLKCSVYETTECKDTGGDTCPKFTC